MDRYKSHILVIGNVREATALFGKPEMTRVHFSRCAKGHDIAALLRQSGRRYDWILVNAASFDGEETPEANQPCGVEWLADGSLQMHCCKRNTTTKLCFSSRNDVPEGDSFVFEYQAPVKRVK